jgi:mycothiol synthase
LSEAVGRTGVPESPGNPDENNAATSVDRQRRPDSVRAVIAIEQLDVLDAARQAAVRELAERLADEIGAPPLNDEALLRLAGRAPDVRHLLATDGPGGRLVGYAQVDGDAIELAADPTALDPILAAAEALTPGAALVWAHGRRSPVTPVLQARGYEQVRGLWQLRAPLAEAPAVPPAPAGVTIRPFVPSVDEAAWLAVNAEAFAHHPEQGSWTLDDVRAREAEPWFDPAGLLLAESAGAVVGFHWTKVHPSGLGEVYVLGVADAWQGRGLGRTLLLAGLAYLYRRGVRGMLLYVEDDNEPALALYRRYGFVEYGLDAQFRGAR